MSEQKQLTHALDKGNIHPPSWLFRESRAYQYRLWNEQIGCYFQDWKSWDEAKFLATIRRIHFSNSETAVILCQALRQGLFLNALPELIKAWNTRELQEEEQIGSIDSIFAIETRYATLSALMGAAMALTPPGRDPEPNSPAGRILAVVKPLYFEAIVAYQSELIAAEAEYKATGRKRISPDIRAESPEDMLRSIINEVMAIKQSM